MAYVGFAARLAGGAALAAILASGCAAIDDPTTPCPALLIGDADAGSVVRAHAPVLAVSAGDSPAVVHYRCDDNGCDLTQSPLLGIDQTNQIMVTSGGGYVLATDRRGLLLLRYRVGSEVIESKGRLTPLLDATPVSFIDSLRGSDWIVARDAQRRLVSYLPAEQPRGHVLAADPAVDVLAVGHDYVVVQGADDELITAIAATDDAFHPAGTRVPLARGSSPTAVTLTSDDQHIAVSLGSGGSGGHETMVFRTSDGALTDRFVGRLAAARDGAAAIPGLSAVSADGAYLAFTTASESLALRDLSTGGACLVHSATTGPTRVAGFAADGVVYFETEAAIGERAIRAWQPSRRYLSTISSTAEGYRLASVPARLTSISPEPWAVGLRNGVHAVIQDNAASYLDVDSVIFAPRDDERIWAVDAAGAGTRDHIALQLRQIGPDAHPQPRVTNTPQGRFRRVVRRLEEACVSTGSPGSWGYQCGGGSGADFFRASPSPTTDDPDSVVPDPSYDACGVGKALSTLR